VSAKRAIRKPEASPKVRGLGGAEAGVAPALGLSGRRSVQRKLLAWYDAAHRDLPWRFPQGEADPYRVWLAEVMLQQTQVAVVIPYYQRFLERYPSLEALAAARDEEVFALWAGLGYYSRCRNLLAAARQAWQRHRGLPDSLEELRALPGFGPYTVGAVASIAFGLSTPAVDGNVVRVLSRLRAIDGDPAAKAVKEEIWRQAGELVEGLDRPGDLNQALMDLGATICTPASPGCVRARARCPLAADCEARRLGREQDLPRPRVRPGRKRMVVACGLIERGSELLLVRRAAGGLFGGLWALPSAEVPAQAVEGGAALARALRGALRARFGKVKVGPEAGRVERTLTHRQLLLVAYACQEGRDLTPDIGAGERWVAWDRIGEVGLSSAMRALLDAVSSSRAGSHHREGVKGAEGVRGAEATVKRRVKGAGRPAARAPRRPRAGFSS
jgi:A/G-specific adenine glycosylase